VQQDAEHSYENVNVFLFKQLFIQTLDMKDQRLLVIENIISTYECVYVCIIWGEVICGVSNLYEDL
jgi:hypothetical protein